MGEAIRNTPTVPNVSRPVPTITLSYSGLSVAFGVPGRSPFAEANYPREVIEIPSFGRSAAGAINREGVSYTEPHTWSISALLRPDDSALLLRIFRLWLADGGDDYLRLHDLIEPVSDRGARTRALATGAPTEVVNGSGISAERIYFAQFNVMFSSGVTRVANGARDNVTFTLIEGAIVAP